MVEWRGPQAFRCVAQACSTPQDVDPSGGTGVVNRSWRAFESECPALAEAGKRLLVGSDGVAIAFLSTASSSGVPHIAPVCPIFSGESLFLSAPGSSPKVRDLRGNPRFALHAFLGANDEEFQIRGAAREVASDSERAAVHEAITFGSFDRNHPVFELSLSGALWVHWQHVGQPDTTAVRRSWRAGHRSE
jgi:hypothetical protein